MVATNETAELALVGTRLGQQVIITHHFRQVEVGVEHSLQELIDAWQAACQATFLLQLTTDYTLAKIRARHVCGALPLDATIEEVVNLPGTSGTATLPTPPWFAAVIRERTAFSGRERRGRYFVPICDETHFAVDTIAAATITALTNYANAVDAAFLEGGTAAADWRLVVYSRKLASVPGTQCQDSSTFVDSLAVQVQLTTQKSRRARPT